MRYGRGLVVGKFCPLHDGHRLVIDAALAACEHVVIISYTKPGFAGYETDKRAAWLETLYPQTTRLVVDDAWLAQCAAAGEEMPFTVLPDNGGPEELHRQFCAWLCERYLGGAVEAVFTSEDYGDGFARALTEQFRKTDPALPEVAHICVDKARAQVPVSGTKLRTDLFKHRAYVPDAVYRSMIKRIALLGGESTGKSTLSIALAKHLKTEYVAEYGRDLWEARNGVLAFEDYLHIAQTQIDWENKASLEADTYLVCDTTPLTTEFYSQSNCGRVDPQLAALAGRAYAHVFLCAADFAFVQDGWRIDEAFRARQQAWYRQKLDAAGIVYHVLTGPVEGRIAQVMAVLERSTVSV